MSSVPIVGFEQVNVGCEIVKSEEEELNLYKCDALGDLVSFVQFQKREEHSWRSVTFSKVAKRLKYLSRFVCRNLQK